MTTGDETTWTGRTGIGFRGPETSALGMGTWVLGGPWTYDGRAAGWGEVDDAVSVRAVHASVDAIDLYQLHAGVETAAGAEDVVAVLETLAGQGLVRW